MEQTSDFRQFSKCVRVYQNSAFTTIVHNAILWAANQ